MKSNEEEIYMTESTDTIFAVNAHLKYVEYLLHVFDEGDESLTLRDIRKKIFQNFPHYIFY